METHTTIQPLVWICCHDPQSCIQGHCLGSLQIRRIGVDKHILWLSGRIVFPLRGRYEGQAEAKEDPMKRREFFCSVEARRDNEQQGGTAMIQTEPAKVTGMDVYRCAILGLVGVFYVFLVFLMFL